MKTNPRTVVTLVVVLAITAAFGLSGPRVAAKTPEVEVAQAVSESLMRQKLHHAQKLLEALAIGDFMRITSNAEDLQRISLEARWTQPHSPNYAEYGEDFRSALERVVRAADNQNIDGAALNYVQVVLTCVQCHKVVREGEEIASLEQGPGPSLLDHEMAKLLHD